MKAPRIEPSHNVIVAKANEAANADRRGTAVAIKQFGDAGY
jgi:hypothetical protein